ncbi:MAG: hypothetical protein ABR608_03650 [Pseudonocardiaceae bacterium]
MSTHHFTLILDRRPSDEELDALFEAGCDDATPATVSGSGWLHFDRDAASLLHALTSAIHDVETAGLGVCAVVSGDLVSLKEIAHRIGRTYEAVRLWSLGRRGPGGFPPPVTSGDGWSLWSWVQAAGWLRTNLLAPVEVSDDERVLAAVDLLVRARCLLADRMSTVTNMLEAV